MGGNVSYSLKRTAKSGSKKIVLMQKCGLLRTSAVISLKEIIFYSYTNCLTSKFSINNDSFCTPSSYFQKFLFKR